MADADIEVIERLGSKLLSDDVVATLHDPDAVRELADALEEVGDEDLEVEMVAPDYVGPRGRRRYTGPEGFVEAWREWVEAYETYTIELGELVQGTEGRVLTLGVQRGRTRTGGVEVTETAAAVWTVRDGKLVRAEFHLDPETAKRAAGLA